MAIHKSFIWTSWHTQVGHKSVFYAIVSVEQQHKIYIYRIPKTEFVYVYFGHSLLLQYPKVVYIYYFFHVKVI